MEEWRAYNPFTGRFMGADPIGYDGGMNLYGYVGNDPINLVDPFGFLSKSSGSQKGDILQQDIDHGAFDFYDEIIVTDIRRGRFGIEDATRYDLERLFEQAFGAAEQFCRDHCDEADAAFRLVVFDYKAEGWALAAEIVMIIPVAKVGKLAKLAKLAKIVCCFTEGTLVATESGLRPIEEIAVGDLVWARDPETGETVLKPVTEVIPAHERQIWEVIVADADHKETVFETTDEHPWWVVGASWKETAELQQGMKLETYDGGLVTVTSATNSGNVGQVFNLTVADFETYFVGDSRILVHNCNLNKIRHIFGQAKHQLGGLVARFGGDTNAAYRAVQRAANEELAAGRLVVGPNGVLPNAGNVLNINGELVQLSGGRVVDGAVEIGSFSGDIRLP